ncbi:ubiquinone biosynthesis hydroxylase [Coralliovum pocilloporae]|uniref:ubiquinone biosynthesis hydroxylase n=1 Tax=Coralliovum pocilloporae TaxID=3066369 RepID=UPI00330759AA
MNRAETESRTRLSTDVVVAGGGYVGLAFALSLKQAAPKLDVILLDVRPPEVAADDLRASAVAASAVRLLDQIGVWREISKDAQPIRDMIVTDSHTDDPVRPIFLSFDTLGADAEPFAHMVPNGVLVAALAKSARLHGVTILAPEPAETFESHSDHILVKTSKSSIKSKLLVAADGRNSTLRNQAGIKTIHWSYGQSGIVTTVHHERPHEGRAEEHFLPSGPFAILPLTGNRSSLVWSEKTDLANRLVKGDDFTFEMELKRRFGHHLGEIEVIGGRTAFPLGMMLARDTVRSRFALAGDSAHGIHPIAGQGLNLGFRDIAALSETIVDAYRLGQDIGSLTVLERYQQWRRFDTWQMGATCDVLNRLFSNDNSLVRAARDFGLGLVDRMPRLKNFFISEAAGFGGEQPRLLRGQPL